MSTLSILVDGAKAPARERRRLARSRLPARLLAAVGRKAAFYIALRACKAAERQLEIRGDRLLSDPGLAWLASEAAGAVRCRAAG